MEIYKVVKIIDDMKIVINAGKLDKVKEGDIFKIIIPGEEVFDPETNESLGTLDGIKATIIVISIYDKMSICQNIEADEVSPLLSINPFLQSKTVPRSLNVDMTMCSGGLINTDEKIVIGDIVVKN